MRIVGGQQIAVACLDPAVARLGLASWAMPVAARVIADGLMSAPRTGVHMSTEQGRPAAQNGHQHFHVQPGQPAAALYQECGSCVANDIGHLKRGPVHRCRQDSVGRINCGNWSSGLTRLFMCLLERWIYRASKKEAGGLNRWC